MNLAVVFAGGNGVRMGGQVPKQFLDLGGKPVLARTLSLFENHPLVDGVYLVAHPEYIPRAEDIARGHSITKLRGVAPGGDTAQESIYRGLKYAAEREPPDSVVLVHDGVRPYVTPEVITANIEAVERYGTAVTYTPCYETVVLSRDGAAVDAVPLRRELYTVQAPQSFRLAGIIAAHERIRARPQGYADMVDQATVCFTLGIPVHLVPGNRGNVKVTTPEDLVTLEALIKWRGRANG
ncbi:MAG: 2-C-methyl-D-erythritol 4-phosphate cytidylyltransferase [Kiritimatiellae bacterium]|nr:2-C-methyl-D-erythritol 4-phosphate cytidylyltransferase [Kiritimatiellia bacterium]